MIELMKALTIHQPYASLLACGAKKYETRSWATNYRGPIAIHAGLISVPLILKRFFPLGEWDYSPDYKAKREFLDAVGKAFEDYAPIEYMSNYLLYLPRGAVIATAELVGCRPIEIIHDTGTPVIVREGGKAIPIYDNEQLFGDWTTGRYAWEFANMIMLPEPIPARGQQGLWNWEGVA